MNSYFIKTSGNNALTFRGAMGATDWTIGWTNWDPQNTAY
jgi:hypothetical protein